MTRTTCEELADRIVDYVDGELPAEEAQTVARHLSECPRCRQIANDLQRSLDLARVIWQDNLADTAAARSMGVSPMSSTAVPAVSSTGRMPVDAPDIHGRDAHATHGQDARATICPYGHTTNLTRRRPFYGLAVAASILLAVGLLMTPVLHQKPGNQIVTAEQIEQHVARVGRAAQLLAATRLVAQCEGTEPIVEQQYRYILREYPGTPAAESIKASHDLKLGGTQHE
jgi:anti-sigma factor RsiW